MKVVLRGKFISLSSFIKRIEYSQINNLSLHLKALEKEQINTKSNRRQEIIKIRAEIYDIETKQFKKLTKHKVGS